jgi:hypothetical protein
VAKVQKASIAFANQKQNTTNGTRTSGLVREAMQSISMGHGGTGQAR